jgi:hypothetical protein
VFYSPVDVRHNGSDDTDVIERIQRNQIDRTYDIHHGTGEQQDLFSSRDPVAFEVSKQIFKIQHSLVSSGQMVDYYTILLSEQAVFLTQ